MIESLVEKISFLVAAYGPWGVFAVALLEEMIAPIPSTLTTVGAGFILLTSYVDLGSVIVPALLFVAVPTALGMTIGGLLPYGIGYYGGNMIIHRWGKWFGITEQSVEKMKRYFNRGHADEVVLAALRAVPIFPNSLTSGVCGLVHYPLRPFLLYSFLGGTVRALVLGLIGWSMGEAYVEYGGLLNAFENIFLLIAILLIAAILVYLFRKKRTRHGEIIS
ncbi:MAG: VTT domain-containing protein [Patescibacteria group bacterium]